MTDDLSSQGKSIDVLNTRGLSAKREYVHGLEQRADAEALSLLVECLCDDSWYLRDLAEETFMRMGERGTVVLLPLLEQGLWFTRTSAARVTGRLGCRAAVPALLHLADDANETVAAAAREALVSIGHAGGGVSVAHALYHVSPEVRQRRLEELAAHDRPLFERLERMMRHEELMAVDDGATLTDDHDLVRASEDGVEWEILTGPPAANSRPATSGSGHGEPGA